MHIKRAARIRMFVVTQTRYLDVGEIAQSSLRPTVAAWRPHLTLLMASNFSASLFGQIKASWP